MRRALLWSAILITPSVSAESALLMRPHDRHSSFNIDLPIQLSRQRFARRAPPFSFVTYYGGGCACG